MIVRLKSTVSVMAKEKPFLEFQRPCEQPCGIVVLAGLEKGGNRRDLGCTLDDRDIGAQYQGNESHH